MISSSSVTTSTSRSLVKIGIETDRGPWVQALIAAGYTVFASIVAAADTASASQCRAEERRGRPAHAR